MRVFWGDQFRRVKSTEVKDARVRRVRRVARAEALTPSRRFDWALTSAVERNSKNDDEVGEGGGAVRKLEVFNHSSFDFWKGRESEEEEGEGEEEARVEELGLKDEARGGGGWLTNFAKSASNLCGGAVRETCLRTILEDKELNKCTLVRGAFWGSCCGERGGEKLSRTQVNTSGDDKREFNCCTNTVLTSDGLGTVVDEVVDEVEEAAE